jgi:hypothetical protein
MVYAFSGMLAFAVDRALTSATFDGPRIAAEPAVHRVTLSSVDDTGIRFSLVCTVAPGIFAVDTLDLDRADLERLSAAMQCQPSGSAPVHS